MAVEFVNHHVHSHFSTLDGLSTPEEIIQRVVDLGQRSVSITDHGTMSGIPQMYRAAKDAGIGFTPGCEIYFTPERSLRSPDRLGEKYYHMIMFAHNQQGYENLSKIQTVSWDEGFYQKPRADYETLEKYSEGLTVTTACLGGIVNQYLLREDFEGAKRELGKLVDIYGKDHVFVELQNHGIDEQLEILGDQRELAKIFDLPLLATTDSHYCTHDEHDVHDSLICTATKAMKSQPGSHEPHSPGEKTRFKFSSDQNFLHSGERMLELFPPEEFPGAISNTVELAERTEFTMNMGENKKYLMPITSIPDGKTDDDILREKVFEGAKSLSRYGDANGEIPDDVRERIDYELGVIKNMRFSSYFLIMENLVRLFDENGISVGAGRGCLHPDTDVLTDRGWVPISEVEVGDTVITANGQRGEVAEVLKHQVYDGEKLVRLVNDRGEKIVLTGKHKVLTQDHHGDRVWRKASEIKNGNVVVSTWGKTRADEELCESKELSYQPKKGILKTPQWGFIVGMMLSQAYYPEDDLCKWDFTPEESHKAETLVNCLKTIFDKKDHPKTKLDDQGNIVSVILKNLIVSQWIKKKTEDHDVFIGMGSPGYTKGFLQAIHQGYSLEPDFKTATANSDFEASAIEFAAMSLGAETQRTDATVEIAPTSYSKSRGMDSMSMIIDVDRVDPDTDFVYDLTIADGHPSFLTRFSTVHNSAPGSVVVYCLGIVKIDPLAHDLYFERFLNPDRISLPDIDIDIPRSRRQEAMEIIEKEYGEGHVAHLSNYNTMGMRDAIVRAAKVFGMNFSEANKFRDTVAKFCEDYGETLDDLATRGPVPPNEIKEKLPQTAHYLQIIKTSAKFVGRIMGNGMHASGLLITDDPLEKNFPLRRAKGAYLPVCQYDGDDTESIGGVKFDLLGLTTLDECINTEKNIALDLGEDVDSSNLPHDDPDVYQLISEGRSGGVFQLGCLDGDTIVDGMTIRDMYHRKHSMLAKETIRSVFMGRGQVRPNIVEDVVYSGVKDTIVLETSSGRILKCTPDHKIFTENGWMKAGDLPEGVRVLTVGDNEGFKDIPLGIRGRENVMELYHLAKPDFRIMENPESKVIVKESFYPTHYNESEDIYAYVYPDGSRDSTKNIIDESMFYPDYLGVDVLSHSQAMEECYEVLDADSIPLPLGTSWDAIVSVSPGETVETFDIMMRDPVNNFIANGIMVHNSSGIKALSRRMKPTEFDDISAELALYRPGPMGLGTHEEYCDRKNGIKPVTAYNDEMKDVLKKTYALTIYQEDIMSLARHFADYTGGEADELRKATAKKNSFLIEKHRKMFVPRVNKKHPGLGDKLWEIIKPFGEYAFNKSHSVAYAVLTYRTAWLKAHYPAQFAGSVIDQCIGNKDKVFETVSWMKQEGMQINPPSVKISELRSVTSDDSVSLPLHIISGLGEKKAQEIIAEREANGQFSSVVDFVSRCRIPASTIESMAKAGAFDDFGASRAAVYSHSKDIVSLAKAQHSRSELSGGLFGHAIVVDDSSHGLDLSDDPGYIMIGSIETPVDDRLLGQWERESIGSIIGRHPFTSIREKDGIEKVFNRYPPIDDFEHEVYSARFCGMIYNINNRISKRGNPICEFLIETDCASVSGITFSHVDESADGSFVAIEGSIKIDGEGEGADLQVVANKIKKVNVDKLGG